MCNIYFNITLTLTGELYIKNILILPVKKVSTMI